VFELIETLLMETKWARMIHAIVSTLMPYKTVSLSLSGVVENSDFVLV
jgi:hypothetical protein